KRDHRSVNAYMKLKVAGGTLQGSYRIAKKAFRGRRSGLAVETIPLNQYDSGAVEFAQVRNRRNGLYPLNGELHKHVYRREMLRYSRRNSPKRIVFRLGPVVLYKRQKKFHFPVSAGSGSNIFLIRNRRLITYSTPMLIPFALLDEPAPQLRFRNSFVTRKDFM